MTYVNLRRVFLIPHHGACNRFYDQVLAKTQELIRDGITEANIASWVVKGEDPYNLGTNRSVYRCALQFLDRVNMAKVLLGEKALQGFETCEEWALTLACRWLGLIATVLLLHIAASNIHIVYHRLYCPK